MIPRPVDRLLNDVAVQQAMVEVARAIPDTTNCSLTLAVVRSLVEWAYQEGRADGMQALIEGTTTTPEKA